MAHILRPTPVPTLDAVPRPAQALRRLAARLMAEPDDEDALRPAAKLYLAAVTLAALGAALVALAGAAAPAPDRLALALALAGAMTLAGLFPVPFTAGTKLYLDTAALVAAVLLFEPGVALLITASGVVLAQAIRRQPWDQTLFNGAQMVLMTAAAGALLAAAGWPVDRLALDRPGFLLLIAAIGLGMRLLNALNVATIVAFQAKESLLPTWASSLRAADREAYLGHMAQVALGVLVAGIAATHSWPLALCLIAAGAVYPAVAHQARLRRQARALRAHQPVTAR